MMKFKEWIIINEPNVSETVMLLFTETEVQTIGPWIYQIASNSEILGIISDS